jgi:hypothetical protein
MVSYNWWELRDDEALSHCFRTLKIRGSVPMGDMCESGHTEETSVATLIIDVEKTAALVESQ